MRHLSATMSAKTTLWMCVALAAAILAAWLVVVLGTPTKPAEAAFPGNNGKIAFVNGCGPSCKAAEIATMKPNGDSKTILTNNGVRDSAPAFSPNGKKIAFESERSGNLDIFTMSANGTNKKQVTTSESLEGDPSWSPDGTRIAFQRGASEEGSITKIYVMKAARESETNRPQRLTANGLGVEEGGPAWSPDGTRIAFFSDQSGTSEIYSIKPDGTGQIQLTTNSNSGASAWSPDGTKIVFARIRGSDSTVGIYVMKAKPESETNTPKRLTGNRFDSFSPDWQPLH